MPKRKTAVKDLLTRVEMAWNETNQWRSLLDDAYSLACPGRNSFQEGRTPGDNPSNEIFDSTLEHAVTRFANRIQAELFPPFQEFLRFVPGPIIEKLDEKVQQQVRAKSDQISAVTFATLANSNFSQSTHEMLIDLSFGTGLMYIDEQPVGTEALVKFIAVNPAEIAIDTGPHGDIWGIFRRHKMRPHILAATWSDAKVKELNDFKDKLEKSYTSDFKYCVDECWYYSSENNKWYLDVIVRNDSDDQSGKRVVERDFNKNRWLVPRWTRTTGESRGRGPTLQALPTAKSLNKAKELLLVNASLQIHPVISYVDDGIFNPGNFDMSPGSLTAVGYNSGTRGSTLQPLDLGGDLQLTQFIFEEMQMDIKKIMLDDQLPPEQGAVRSATEWTARQKELAGNVSAPFGRLYNEFTRPLMETLVDILKTRGVLEQELSIDGNIIDIQLTSPFAQAQNIHEVNSMAQYVEMMLPLGPELFNLTTKTENIGAFYLKKMGLPVDLFARSPEEQQQAMQQAQQAQQAQAEEEQGRLLEQEEAKQGGQTAI